MRNKKVIATGSRTASGPYTLDGVLAKPAPVASALLASSATELTTWHRRLAHVSPRAIDSLSQSDHVTGLSTNGIAERVNSTIFEGVLSFFQQFQAPKDLRGPLSIWRGKRVRVDHLRVWGCRAWHTITHGRAKLDARAIPLVFVEYDGNTAAYLLFEPRSGRIIRLRYARFVKHKFPSANSAPTAAAPTAAGEALIFTSANLRVNARPALQVADPAPSTPAPTRFRHVDVRRPVHVRALVSSTPPASPPPAAQDPPSSPDPLDFLSDPFLLDVIALAAAAGNSLSASDDAFALPTSDPRSQAEAVRDVDADSWRQGEHNKFTLLRHEYGVYHIIDRD
ncbi:GAG-pre-integrase domain-containing protein [Rhodotorula paludigena]|uniref:GAG-pre-integrase domain-containing protein n=1 Tax=Rhodotorula paludigena TaxID=86838 RepID=UPI003181CE2D